MKKAFLASLIAIPSSIFAYSYQDNPSYKIQTELYSQSYQTESADIVMLGDSITYRVDWRELLKNKQEIMNRGIDGDTTEGMYNRLDDVISMKPKKVYIMAGINDIGIGYSVGKIFDNYKEIISKLRKADIQVIVQSTLYTSNSRANAKVTMLDKLLEKYCIDNEIKYIDLNKDLAPNEILKSEYTYDGLHLNYKGYNVWRESLVNL